MRVLAIAAHPDDLELLCGGTLAKYAKRGDTVFMAYLTTGDKGGKAPREELAATRRGEAEASAAVIGATPLHGFIGDLELYDERAHRDLVMDFIRTAQPDVLFNMAPNCYHADHRIANRVVFGAAYCSTIPNYPSPGGVEPYSVRAPILHMDTVAGIDFEPEEYVDISDVWDLKQRMIECHESQIQWLKGYRRADLLGIAETQSRVRGIQCGVEFAEGFRREGAWGRLRPSRLLP